MRLLQKTQFVVVVAISMLVSGLATPAVAGAEDRMPGQAAAAHDARLVLRLLNQERAAHGLSALRWNAQLTSLARAHNARMARTDTLEHQLPGERSFPTQVSGTGYRWNSCGENIALNPDWSRTGVLYLEKMMYHEKPPENGHRLNILDHTYRAVGIDVRMDARHHKAWLTEVFASPR
jgi:uncharacterized protein YkwD